MSDIVWAGVMPAITTPFRDDGEVDHDFIRRHVQWLVDHGATGIVPLGSLGEGSTLRADEKRAIISSCVEALDGRAPVVPGIAAAATEDAIGLAKDAERLGCRGLMVLPPYLHRGPIEEVDAHLRGVLGATSLPCMLYNNPIAYGTDILPEHIAALAASFDSVAAVKESSGDLRRFTAIRALIGDRLALFAGLDDMIVEAVHLGATGWIAGLVNAMPRESVVLFDRARGGDVAGAFDLYRWFLPLLRLDTEPEFVQLIKLVQQTVDMGSERVRLPRLPVQGALRDRAVETIRAALAAKPDLS